MPRCPDPSGPEMGLGRGIYRVTPARCVPCMENGRRCDAKRPCDSCVANHDRCTGNSSRCFWRGVAGDEMYGYYLTLGFGPGGVNDPPTGPPDQRWEMPDDYHIQYVQVGDFYSFPFSISLGSRDFPIQLIESPKTWQIKWATRYLAVLIPSPALPSS